MNVPGEYTDEMLFEQLKTDDQIAFKILYNRYWDRLLQVAQNKLQIQEDAEEVVQEVFLAIWSARNKTTLKYSFNTYISAVLKYTIFSKITARARYENVELQEELENTLVDHSTEQYLAFSEAISQIEILVSQLPEKCQMVFRLSRDQDLSNKEIATDMGVSEKTVEGHITKALKYIRANLNQFSFFFTFF